MAKTSNALSQRLVQLSGAGQITNGRVCGRRVGVLYLAGSKSFGCRHCHNLTYESFYELIEIYKPEKSLFAEKSKAVLEEFKQDPKMKEIVDDIQAQ